MTTRRKLPKWLREKLAKQARDRGEDPRQRLLSRLKVEREVRRMEQAFRDAIAE